MAGKVLGGRYTVQDRIGTGGMAVVYRGLDEVLGRTVAIKTMLPQYASDPSFAARFKQEAQAAAALQSPYIVNVYDWGKDGDTYYIVMEYLRGTDLKSGIRKHGALDCKKVAQIGSQIALALSEAHRHDIIHRDIKPQNIMVLRNGNIKVMDFGIARAKNSHLTTDNSVLGTAHYVSPEQTQGKELGPTTDIYSLGIVMYEAATGQVPFDGDDAITVALKQVNEQPNPPSQINPNIDPSLEGIILKCMQKDPGARFQTADELYHVLRDYLAGRIQKVNEQTSVISSAVTTVAPVQAIDTIGQTAAQTARNTPRITQRVRHETATDAAKRQAEEHKRRQGRRKVVTILGFLVLLAVVGTAVAMVMSNRGTTQAVPNLLNLKQEEALKQIDDSDFFKRGDVTSEYSSTVAEGLVISQNPVAGKKAERNTRISLVISKGEEPKESVSVPDLRNMLPSEAQAALAAVGLKGENGDSVFDSEIENGKVATQEPKAGSSAKEGDTITYHLSKGKETVEVPNVVGEHYTTAETTLKDKGFQVELAYDNSSNFDKDYVMEQSKTGTAEKGSTIRLIVSLGKSTIEVPNVIGYDQASAISTLENAGFTVSVTQQASDITAGQVIDQSMSGTVSADSGHSVTIYVSTGPETTPTDDPTSGTTDTDTDHEHEQQDASSTTTGTTTTE